MTKKLEEAFHKYIDVVQPKLQKRNEEVKKGPLRLLADEAMALRTLVDELENKTEFCQLVEETHSSFSGDYHHGKKSTCQQAIKNFFRRSGYYFDIFKKKALNADAAFQNYCEAFQKREIQVTYLAPMEFVHSVETSMNFETFQIQQFSEDELKAIFKNRINEVFYPWAAIDVRRLQNYWFIHFAELASIPKLGKVYLDRDLDQIDRVNIKYTNYPKPIESILQHLALFDWQADLWQEPPDNNERSHEEELEKGWLGFHIPFVLRVDDNPLDSPRTVPDISGLITEPVLDSSGEEIGEAPTVYISLDQDETAKFKAFIQKTMSLLGSLKIKENNWQFLETASGYFIKAFFAEGLEQLLWHITVLEALLGEKGEGVTKRLAQRIALILGENKNKRKSIKKNFKALYDFRCSLVHGNSFQKQAYVGHLRDARNLARQTLLWFLHYLNEIQTEFSKDEAVKSIPTRKEILMLIDLEKNSRVHLTQLINTLPNSFPYIHDWIN